MGFVVKVFAKALVKNGFKIEFVIIKEIKLQEVTKQISVLVSAMAGTSTNYQANTELKRAEM